MDNLGRYYTNENISRLLISKFKQNSPNQVLELGVGEGSLLKHAITRWKRAKYYATDIDRKSISYIIKKHPLVNSFKANGLNLNLASKINIQIGSIDIAICNPPYKRLKNNSKIQKLLKKAQLIESSNLKYVTSDIIFLAQNLLLLKNNGELGIILPDSIVTGYEFIPLRKDLLKAHKINHIIQLPDKIFNKTEARTHILIIEKNKKQSNEILLTSSDQIGRLTKPLKISIEECYHRMDYKFYEWKQNVIDKIYQYSLKAVKADIKRGSYSEKELKALDVRYFHTSSFSNQKLCGNFPKKSSLINGLIAKKGDILIARVGKRCIGKILKVNSGEIILTDCIYRIRVSKKYISKLWNTFKSKSGQEWLKAYAHGVCAQVISKKDLLNFKF